MSTEFREVESRTLLWSLRGPFVFEYFVDHGLETDQVSIPQKSAVYEDRWGASNSHEVSLSQIPVDYRLNPRVFSVLVELLHIQVELLCNLCDFLLVQAVVILEEQIMEFPEFTLSSRRNDCNSRLPGKFVGAQGEVFEDKFHTFGILLEHLLEYRHKPGTVRSLEVAEDSDHDWCIGIAPERGARDVDLLDEIQCNNLNGLLFSTGEEKDILSRTDLDAFHMLVHGNRVFEPTV